MLSDAIAERLQLFGVLTGLDPVVQCFVYDTALGELSLDVFMPIDTKLGGVREVRAELQEKRAKVAIDTVKVVMIDHRGRADNPGVASACLGISAAFASKHPGLLLNFADEQYAFCVLELRPILRRDVILAFALFERQ